MLHHRDAQPLGIVGDTRAPALDQLVAVQRDPLEEAGRDLRDRRLEALVVDEQAVELVLDVAHRDHADLALDAVERELVEEPVRPVREQHRRRPRAELALRGGGSLRRRHVLRVHDQVEVGVAVGVAARPRAREDRAGESHVAEIGVRDPPGELAEVMLWGRSSGDDRRLTPLSENAPTYESAGVSLATATAVVDRLRSAVESTGATGFGTFAGLYPLDEGRFLAASTDSVGSKLLLQRRAGKLRWGGMDLAAHCINDVLCSGAEPLFFLDYVAAEHIELEQVADLVEGAAEVCRRAGCMLIGGETAELPGVYRENELDFAGTCVGLVARDDVIDGSRCAAGDLIVGLPSDGIHTNGFSLVRALVGDGDFDAELLLTPHRLYLDEVRALRAAADVKALAHVTGGGILGNLSRVLPDGVHARIDWDAWTRPPVFHWLAEQGVEEDEARRVFNLGIGMCAVVPEAPAGAIVIGALE